MLLLVHCCMLSVLLVKAGANLQAWSEQSYLNVAHILLCNSTTQNFNVTADSVLLWKKLGQAEQLQTGTDYELLSESSVANYSLRIKNVTPKMAGIYFCYIFGKDGIPNGLVVKGLNVVEPLLEDNFDEYRTSVIRGVISAASVFALVVGISVVDRFRFLTPEQKQKRTERKDKLKRQQQQQTPQNGRVDNYNGGVDNLALENNSEFSIQVTAGNGAPQGPTENYTHL